MQDDKEYLQIQGSLAMVTPKIYTPEKHSGLFFD